MAVSGKYGTVDIPGIGADEPVFILRAQDLLAEATIEMYRILTSTHGCPVKESLNVEIERFKSWSGKRKLPD
jgi:hypothetical protein|uniref:Uncharacterized protein n=1 Tax=Desulfacinum infernum TaxID=35837 RepID=A0A832A6C9_9BACT